MITADLLADLFTETAFLLELSGENPFKIRSFQSAADYFSEYQGELSEAVATVLAGKAHGLGKGLQGALKEIVAAGSSEELQQLRSQYPATLCDLLKVRGLGAKKIKTLYEQEKIATLEELERACLENRVSALKGFGAKTQTQFLESVREQIRYRMLVRLDQAHELYARAERDVSGLPGVLFVAPLGELRRGCEVLSSVDMLVVADDPASIALGDFTPLDGAYISPRHSRVRLYLTDAAAASLTFAQTSCGDPWREAAPATLWSQAPSSPRSIADLEQLEREQFKLAQLAWVSSEYREESAQLSRIQQTFASGSHELALVTPADVRGVLHVHSTYSDGVHTLRQLAEAAQAKGYEYLGISDHSRTAVYARGLSIDDVFRQHTEIDFLNEEFAPFRIFKGIESDILQSGELDYPDDVLERFEFVIASVHSRFSMSREAMTTRIINAVKNPFTTILGHPTGRLLLRRQGYELEMEAILDAAAEHRCAIELNANPHRLDLDWRWHEAAIKRGILIPVSPDAHSVLGLDDTEYGLRLARKGGLGPDEVLNTLSVDDLAQWFAEKRTRAL